MSREIYALSNSAIISDLGKRFTSYRKRMGFTQKEISEHTGLSVFTISSFERGSATGLTLFSFIKLLRAVECLEEIDKLLPELPISPKELFKKHKKL